uniref:Uncharacterized protein n=1 Tax=Anguilla anguilla TaxID=7936 RepID=A0A0E9RR38_ANGAN
MLGPLPMPLAALITQCLDLDGPSECPQHGNKCAEIGSLAKSRLKPRGKKPQIKLINTLQGPL